MERIKLAIEKARAGQLESLNTTVALFPAAPEAAPKTDAEALDQVRTEEVGPVEVQYTKTSVVQLDGKHLERQRVVAHQKSHPAGWAFDVLRTQVLQKMDENGWRTLAITSPSVESGKTLVSTNLAMSIAQLTHRTVLLVDFDLRRPSVAKTLGLSSPRSLNDVLAGRCTVAEALVNPGVERFVVLPTNEPVARASEALSSAKVGHLVNEMRNRYGDRIVIFDLPPILAADDVMTVLPRIDCVLLIVGSGTSTESEIEEAMTRLAKANLIGVVLNKDEGPAQNSYY